MSKYSYIACIEGDTSGIVNAMKGVEERGKDLNRRMKVINEGAGLCFYRAREEVKPTGQCPRTGLIYRIPPRDK